MSDFAEQIANLSPKRLALLAYELHAELEAAQQARNEPIAVVGIGCRFPGGADTADAFWQRLYEGRDAIGEVPADRWDIDAYYDPDPDAPGKMSTRYGAFLEQVDQFDAEFFGISSREANRMEPQQRLLLEVAWEAIESAGLAPARLAGTRAGVFVGVCGSDYARWQFADPERIDAYAGSGIAHSIVANRLSYLLDLQGPSLAVDTACSSSLVAVHLACQSLRNNESDLALAGGVNLILSPEASITFSKARMMAPDGRCKTFDAQADGYVRGEGCGVVVLKRLSDALADGDPIWAVIRGSAVNQDGHSNGLTAPNLLAQQAVLRQALRNAGVRPDQVGYIEAHGTGTALGDPIEVEALRAVYGQPRPDGSTCALASVKTNIGHLEGAAGIAGLIKVVLALRHASIPAHLHFKQLNPNISLAGTPFVIPTSPHPWTASGATRLAGVSSFGFGGTNAHIILEEAPPQPAAPVVADRPCHLLVLSAHSDTALRTLAARYRDHLAAHPDLALADVCYTSQLGRAHFPHRLALTAATLAEAAERLGAAAAGTQAPGVWRGLADDRIAPKIAFLFSGQGSQYVGMGRQLYQTQPTFRAALDRCAELLMPHLGQDLRAVLYGGSGIGDQGSGDQRPETGEEGPERAAVIAKLAILDPRSSILDPRSAIRDPRSSILDPRSSILNLDQTWLTQPALFALEWALAELWESWGIAPGALLGHSVGEYVAACRAGVFSLEEGLRLVAARGRLMERATRDGAMAAVFAPAEQVAAGLSGYRADLVAVAAVNATTETVIAGAREVVEAALREFTAAGIKSRLLPGAYAFHSPLLEPMLDSFEAEAATVRFARPRLAVMSNLTGQLATAGDLQTPQYWRRQAREPVKFAPGLKALWDAGYRVFVEVGPQPRLLGLGQRDDQGGAGVWLPSLRKGQADWAVLSESLGRLDLAGAEVNWDGFHRDEPRRRVALPAYPFQRTRYWVESGEPEGLGKPSWDEADGRPSQPLIGRRLQTALRDVLFESAVGVPSLPFLDDHRIRQTVVVPAAYYLALAFGAAQQTFAPGPYTLKEVLFQQSLVLSDQETRAVQLVLTPATETTEASFQIFSRPAEKGEQIPSWELHTSGNLAVGEEASGAAGPTLETIASLRERCQAVPGHVFYDEAAGRGLEFGASFRWLGQIWRGESEGLGELRRPDRLVEADSALHPGLIDACFQLLAALIPAEELGTQIYLPISVEQVRWHGQAGQPALIHAQLRPSTSASTRTADLCLLDASGLPLLDASGLALARIDPARLAPAALPADTLAVLDWLPAPLPALPTTAGPAAHFLLVADRSGLARALADLLQQHGHSTHIVALDPASAHDPDAISALLAAALAPDQPACRALLYLGALDTPAAPSPFPDALAPSARTPLLLVQALLSLPAAPPLWLLTRGALAVGPLGACPAPSQALLWGLGAVVPHEHPELICQRLDLDPGLPPAASAPALLALLLADQTAAGESVRAIRGGLLYRPRLGAARRPDPAATAARQLLAAPDGGLDALRLVPLARRSPGPGEVELAVAASGLNFRDVLTALGLLGETSPALGGECAGTVVATGPGVEHLSPGTRVVALAQGSLASHVTVPAGLVAPIPPTISLAEAAGLPIAFLTVRYALEELGELQAGQRVLIHSAAGGVGLAAVQWASKRGALVYATAGSPHKRALLLRLGCRAVADSRSLGFADEIRAATGGAGVDVVLGAQLGQARAASLSVLAQGGCFLELGKRELWSPDELALLRPDVRYRVVDLLELTRERPGQVGAWLAELLAQVAHGELWLPPVRTLGLAAAPQAFRALAEGQHVGKLVLVAEPDGQALPVRAEASYLISGGLGGLGLQLAHWLVAMGAGHLALLGRHPPTAAQQAQLEQLRRSGAQVLALAADVSEAGELAQALRQIAAELPPLRGVIHAAGVLDDGMLLGQSWQRMAVVLAPKLLGAWQLHQQTQPLPLDWFVLCSSAAGLLGSPGQASYAAANAFLDSLAQARQPAGQCALSLDWGPIANLGMSAQVGAVAQARWAAAGIGLLPASAVGTVLAQALALGTAQVLALPRRARAAGERQPGLLGEWLGARAASTELRAATAGGVPPAKLVERLAGLGMAARAEAVLEHVLALARQVLGGEARLAPERPLHELGLDSLLAVELRNLLGRSLGQSLPATLLFDYPSPAQLRDYLLRHIPGWDVGATPQVVPEAYTGASAGGEAIAIVGMGCRLPGGVRDPQALWELLAEGVDAIGEVPQQRWDSLAYYDETGRPGTMNTRWGGFLEDVAGFDAPFFSIAPREAVWMDPQQRLLLEVSWEALERAAVVPEQLLGSPTGVFVGISTTDYAQLQKQHNDLADIDAYTGTGGVTSVAAGRLAYVLGLQGPCMALDTACSSALVAVHLACQSLRNRECNLALAGAVNVILNPEGTVYFSKLGVMAPDGRCKTFDARADGYVRSEGCGVLVLKRLADALAASDPICAIIRGSAVNQDGRSNGLTAPNGPAQAALIRQALARAQLAPAQVGYVEAHGTGTALGDPIEAQALAEVLGQGRALDQPLLIGSVKTNLGHLEAAAGMAGLLKAVLALQHGQIPPHLHFETPNPHIAWAELPLAVPTTLTPWPASSSPRIAGVSSFGFSGTNAHVVLEQAPQQLMAGSAATQADPSGAFLLPLSARSPAALRALAQAYRDRLEEQPAIHDLCYSASLRRSHHEQRLAVVGTSSAELAEALDAYLRGEQRPGISAGSAPPGQRPPLVFVFPGQGSQYVGMAGGLLAQEPIFRATIEQCQQAFHPYVDWSLLDVLTTPAAARLDQIDVIQPTLFAIQVGLAALWRSWGIVPDAVVGHSMGEVAAAQVAGCLSLDEAARIICRRSQLLGTIGGQGAMALVELSLAEAEALVAPEAERLAVAASNSPRATVLAGERAALEALLDQLRQRGSFAQLIKVEVAAHSPQVEPLRGVLLTALADLAPAAGSLPFYSTVEGQVCDGRHLDAAYWVANLRQRVQLWPALQRLVADGYQHFLELSPHPVLLPALLDGLRELGAAGTALPSLRRGEDERTTLLSTLAALYVQGQPLAWHALYPADARYVELPTYPWQHERFWIADQQQPGNRHAGKRRRARPQRTSGHPLLGERLELSVQTNMHIWQLDLAFDTPAFLADHSVAGSVVLPASAYVEMALLAATEAFGASVRLVEQVSFERLLVLPADAAQRVQVVLTGDVPGEVSFQISSRLVDSVVAGGAQEPAPWTLHATGKIALGSDSSAIPVEPIAPAEIQNRCPDLIDGHEYYQALADRGLEYGPNFQGLSKIWRRDGEAIAALELPAGIRDELERYTIHPSLLDICFQVLGAALPHSDGAEAGAAPYLPISLASLQLVGRPHESAWVHARLVGGARGADTVEGELMLLDAEGRAVLRAIGLRARRLEPPARPAQHDELAGWLYTLQWQPATEDEPEPVARPAQPAGTWLILAHPGEAGEALKSFLQERGETCITIMPGEQYERLEPGRYRLHPADPAGFRQLLRDAFTAKVPACRGVLYLWGSETAELTLEALATARELGCVGVLHLVQALAQTGWRDAPRLWLITRGTQPIDPATAQLAIEQAPLWGLGRTIALEHPELQCTRVDLSRSDNPAEIDMLCRACWSGGRDDEIAWRGEVKYVTRLVRTSILAPQPRLRGDSTYLLTGGLGGIGLTLARWMVGQGARHLVLIGRSEPSEAAQAAIAEMRATGATIVVARADVSRGEEVVRVIEEIDRTLPELRGVLHAAGILDDGILLHLTPERLRRVMAPKIEGAWNLHTHTLDKQLDYFVLCSSASALLGSPGQASYTAANMFLDALAHYRRALSRPALSINWGPWAAVGLAAAQDNRGARLALQGIGSLTPQQGVYAFERLLEAAVPQIAVVPFNLRQWREFYPAAANMPLLDTLMRETAQPGRAASADRRVRDMLRAADIGQRRELLEAHLREQIGQVLRLAPSRIDAHTPLGSLGLDSLMGLEIRNRLESSLGLTLSATLLWTYPNINTLAIYLAGTLELPLEEPAGARAAASQPSSELTETISQIEHLSDAEAELLLLQELSALDQRSEKGS